MAIEMYRLKMTEQRIRKCCPTCIKRGHIDEFCKSCNGNGTIRSRINRYEVTPHTLTVYKIDRDPKTGILRYWESADEFYYETTTPELNKYVPEVPHGIHLVHYTRADAELERDRVNKELDKVELKSIGD